MAEERTVSAYHFIEMLVANVDGPNLDDKHFREFVRNSLPIVVQSIEDDPDYAELCSKHDRLQAQIEEMRNTLRRVI